MVFQDVFAPSARFEDVPAFAAAVAVLEQF